MDWTQPIDPALDRWIRDALIQRAAKILKFGPEWRKHEVYTFESAGLYQGRIKNERTPAMFVEPVPPQPTDLAAGDWVKLKADIALGVAGRVGVIRYIHYSPQVCARRDGTYRKCWQALVEFPRLRRSKVSSEDRIRYKIPVDCLELTTKPETEEPPLSMHPEAVRGRKRKEKGDFGRIARRHFADLKPELT